MESAKIIRELRERTGMTRKAFSEHTRIPVRTLENWEAGRRRPPEYVPRLIEYQLKYEELIGNVSTRTVTESGNGGKVHERSEQ